MKLINNISSKDYYKLTSIFGKYLKMNLTQSQIEELNKLLGITEELYNHPDNNKFNTGLMSICKDLGVKVYQDLEHSAMSYFHPGEGSHGSIHVSDNPLPHIFAHEIGHAYSFNGKGTWKDRLSHNLYGVGIILTRALGSVLGIGGNIILGKSLAGSAMSSTVGLIAVGLIPYIVFSPTLYQEKYASKMALKFLSDLGADERYIQLSNLSLKLAYKTYKSVPFQVMITNLGSYGLGWGSTKIV